MTTDNPPATFRENISAISSPEPRSATTYSANLLHTITSKPSEPGNDNQAKPCNDNTQPKRIRWKAGQNLGSYQTKREKFQWQIEAVRVQAQGRPLLTITIHHRQKRNGLIQTFHDAVDPVARLYVQHGEPFTYVSVSSPAPALHSHIVIPQPMNENLKAAMIAALCNLAGCSNEYQLREGNSGRPVHLRNTGRLLLARSYLARREHLDHQAAEIHADQQTKTLARELQHRHRHQIGDDNVVSLPVRPRRAARASKSSGAPTITSIRQEPAITAGTEFCRSEPGSETTSMPEITTFDADRVEDVDASIAALIARQRWGRLWTWIENGWSGPVEVA